MNCRYWLPLSLLAAAVALSAGCSPKFTSCDACASSEANGGAEGRNTGKAGSAGASKAGASNASGGPAVGDTSDTSDTSDAGSGGEGGAEEPALSGACSERGRIVCSGLATAQRLACDGSKWLA